MNRVLALLLVLAATLTANAQSMKKSRLEVIDIHTGQRTVIREFPYVVEAPNWTHDGRWIVYNSQGHLYRLRADGKGKPRQIDTGSLENINNDHVLAAKGRRLAVSNHDAPYFVSRIYTLPLKGGKPRLVTPKGNSYLHGWSPDGRTMAYCADRNGQWDVYTISIDGGEEQRLTTAEGLDDGPEYAPDGQHIWFNSVRTGLMQVWRMKADGSEQTQMTFENERNAWFPHVSPDGKWVVYIAYHRGDLKPDQHLPGYYVDLRLMPAEGGQPRTLTTLFGGQGSLNVNSWAPDSRRLCFVSYEKE